MLLEDEVKLMVMMVKLNADLLSIGCSGHGLKLDELDGNWFGGRETVVVDGGCSK